VYAGALLVPGNAHEVGPFYDQPVAQFVASAGQGVIKWLILDRGFIDGERISRCKRDWGIDVLIPMKKNMDIWTDAWALAPQGVWQRRPEPAPAVPPLPPQRPERLQRRETKRQETLAQLRAQQPPPPPADVRTYTEFCPLHDFTRWTAATVPIHVVLLRDH